MIATTSAAVVAAEMIVGMIESATTAVAPWIRSEVSLRHEVSPAVQAKLPVVTSPVERCLQVSVSDAMRAVIFPRI